MSLGVTPEGLKKLAVSLSPNIIGTLPIIESSADLELVRAYIHARPYENLELCLSPAHFPQKLTPLKIEAEKALRYHTSQHYLVKEQPLARALGKSQGPIWDAMGGLGQDSLLMHALGYSVFVTERDLGLYCLLKEAFSRGIGRVEWGHCFEINDLPPECSVMYLDPMYTEPPQKRKALPKGPMQFLHLYLPPQEEAFDLEQCFQKPQVRRVVVKRSLKAPALWENPSITYQGKTTRYDVYLP